MNIEPQRGTVRWIEDVTAIQVIERLGLRYQTRWIRAAEIDKKASSVNKARDVALDAERAELIAASMRAGILIPAIVVCVVQNRTYVIAGGNHRFYAANTCCGDLEVLAHVVEAYGAEFETLCKMLNLVVGEGVNKAVRIRQAADAVSRLGLEVTQAAKLYFVDADLVRKQTRNEELMNKAVAIAPTARRVLSMTHMDKLAGIAGNNPMFAAAVNAAVSGKMTALELADAVSVARKRPSEAEAVSYFQSLTSTHRAAEGRKIPRKKHQRLLSALGAIESVLSLAKTNDLSDFEVLVDEREAICKRLRSVASIIRTICKSC